MINYNILNQSILHYEQKGFVRIEVPWWVGKEISDLTKPKDVNDYFLEVNQKVLVASGEQSFLYLANKGQLPKGKFQTTTPCFRNETIDLLHNKHFIKNELINTKNINKKELDLMLKIAYSFFNKYISKKYLSIEETESHLSETNFDIIANVGDNKYELGSYGIRKCEILHWIYGTGCAEPRLSKILDFIKLHEERKK